MRTHFLMDNRQPSSLTLIERAQAGDQAALETLVARYRPRLERWASGRLPRWARDIADTQDLVQETLFQTFKRIESFENRGDGALQAYLRHAILNRIREELRRWKRRPHKVDFDSKAADDERSPLEEAIGQEALARYRAGAGRPAAGGSRVDRGACRARLRGPGISRSAEQAECERRPDGARAGHRAARERNDGPEDVMPNDASLHELAGGDCRRLAGRLGGGRIRW